MRLRPAACAAVLIIAGCVSVGELPQTAVEVDAEYPDDGVVKWRTYAHTVTLDRVDINLVIAAAQGALIARQFEIRSARTDYGAVIGSAPPGVRPASTVVGVYSNPAIQGAPVRILVMSPPDILPSLGKQTAEDIGALMQIYVESENASTNESD